MWEIKDQRARDSQQQALYSQHTLFQSNKRPQLPACQSHSEKENQWFCSWVGVNQPLVSWPVAITTAKRKTCYLLPLVLGQAYRTTPSRLHKPAARRNAAGLKRYNLARDDRVLTQLLQNELTNETVHRQVSQEKNTREVRTMPIDHQFIFSMFTKMIANAETNRKF